MSIQHRLPALATAIMSSMAVVLIALAGSSCDLIQVSVVVNENDDNGSSGGNSGIVVGDPDNNSNGTDNNNLIDTGIPSTSIGVLCDDHEIFTSEGDPMWELSQIFFFAAVALGSLTASLAWAVTTYLSPTETNWKLLSLGAATTAVVSIPIFVLFESEPCTAYRDNQTCTLGFGSYLLIASIILFVAVTLCTQCMDPPKWALELALWRTTPTPKKKKNGRNSRTRSGGSVSKKGSKRKQSSSRRRSRQVPTGDRINDNDDYDNNSYDNDNDEVSLNRDYSTVNLTPNDDARSRSRYEAYYHRQGQAVQTYGDGDDNDDDNDDIESPLAGVAVDNNNNNNKLPNKDHTKERQQQGNQNEGWFVRRWFGSLSNDTTTTTTNNDPDTVPQVETQSIDYDYEERGERGEDGQNDYENHNNIDRKERVVEENDVDDYVFEDQLDDDRVELRVLPDRIENENDGSRRSGGSNTNNNNNIANDDNGTSQSNRGHPVRHVRHASVPNMLDDMEEDDHAATSVPPSTSSSMPPSSTIIRKTLSTNDADNNIERHRYDLDSLTEPPAFMTTENTPHKHAPVSTTTEDILVDLQKVSNGDCAQSTPKVESYDNNTVDNDKNQNEKQIVAETSTDKVIRGVRNLTKMLKRDTERRRSRRRQAARNGYTHMIDDDDEDDDDDYDYDYENGYNYGNNVDDVFDGIGRDDVRHINTFTKSDEYDSDDGTDKLRSPPFEVQFPMSTAAAAAATTNGLAPEATGTNNTDMPIEDPLTTNVMPDISDDEDDLFDNDVDNWNIVGISRSLSGGEEEDKGLIANENCVPDKSLTDDRDMSNGGIFDGITMDSSFHDDDHNHSSSQSFDNDILPPPTLSEMAADISTVSSSDFSHSNSPGRNNHDSRGRQMTQSTPTRSQNAPPRTKRAPSPVGSIKSHGSLLHTTINEETAEDIEKELEYSLTRTLLEPRLGSKVTPLRMKRSALMSNTAVRVVTPPSKDETKKVDTNTKPPLAAAQHTMHHAPPLSPVKSTWTESVLTTSLSKKSVLGLPPLGLRRNDIESLSNINTSAETAHTEKTDCTDDSTISDDDDGTRPQVRRSRSMGPSNRPVRRETLQTTSLSPSRFGKDSDDASKAKMARSLRLRRLQKKAGYVSLNDSAPDSPKQGLPVEFNEQTNNLTPKRKTIHLIDEKKEDDDDVGSFKDYGGENVPSPYLDSNDLSLPALSDKDSVLQYIGDDHLDVNVDSVLEKLDLELIQVRRPLGREYGDDELSL